jgi:hypothetical protein
MTKSTRKNNDRAPKARQAASRAPILKNGFYVLPSCGAVVTNELVAKIQQELDEEDARRAWCLPDTKQE